MSLLRCWLLGDWLNAHSKDAGWGITTLPYFLFLCAHNFPLKACLASADCSTPSATVENYSKGGSPVSRNTVGVVPCSPPSPSSVHRRGKESMSLFLYRLAWMLNFTLRQSSHRLLIERHSHTFPTGHPWNPQTSLARNKHLQIQESSGNAMGNLSMFHFLIGMAQLSSDG